MDSKLYMTPDYLGGDIEIIDCTCSLGKTFSYCVELKLGDCLEIIAVLG